MKFSSLLLSCTAFLSLTQSTLAGGMKGGNKPAPTRALKKTDGPYERECEFCKFLHFLSNTCSFKGSNALIIYLLVSVTFSTSRKE